MHRFCKRPPRRRTLKKKSQCERPEFSIRENILSLGHGPNTDWTGPPVRNEALLVGRETTWEEGLGLAWLASRRFSGLGLSVRRLMSTEHQPGR